mgnify:CR=1 FL=1
MGKYETKNVGQWEIAQRIFFWNRSILKIRPTLALFNYIRAAGQQPRVGPTGSRVKSVRKKGQCVFRAFQGLWRAPRIFFHTVHTWNWITKKFLMKNLVWALRSIHLKSKKFWESGPTSFCRPDFPNRQCREGSLYTPSREQKYTFSEHAKHLYRARKQICCARMAMETS